MSGYLFTVAVGLIVGALLGIRRERAFQRVVNESDLNERYDDGYEAGFQEGKRVMREEHISRAEYVLSLHPESAELHAVVRALGGGRRGRRYA